MDEDGWIDEWMNKDGWMDGLMNEWMNKEDR